MSKTMSPCPLRLETTGGGGGGEPLFGIEKFKMALVPDKVTRWSVSL